MSLQKALDFFDKYAPTVLAFDFKVGGETSKMDALRELTISDGDLGNPVAFRERIHKIPGMITFYGTLKDQADREFKEAEEDFSHWESEESSKANQAIIEETQKLEVAAGLKKAPTMDQIKGRVRRDNPTLWRQKQDNLNALESRAKALGRILDGLKAMKDLCQTSAQIFVALVTRGMEDLVIYRDQTIRYIEKHQPRQKETRHEPQRQDSDNIDL